MDRSETEFLTKFNLNKYLLNEELARLLPENIARRFGAILLKEEEGGYVVGMTNPTNLFAVDELRYVLKRPLKPVLVKESDLQHKLDQLYRKTGEITNFAGKLAAELNKDLHKNGDTRLDIEQDEHTVIKLLNSLLEDAIQIAASDIHIEPAAEVLRIRLRVDGLLQEQVINTAGINNIARALIQRLKLMAGLNIEEKRLPQDGRFDAVVYGKQIEIRLSTLPIMYGETVVLRLLNKSNKILDLDGSGMPANMLQQFRRLIKLPSGIILVTGPTGSGKTTTLYGALSEINDVTKNIVTIEDPIEYTLERINQVQVNAKIDLTFARVLRSVLRQDPDIVLIGEIRDQETASIALRAALTGHLVFATLHTNDAPSTAIRLLDMNVESYLVATTVRVIIAQRLVRKICVNCIEPHTLSVDEQIFFANFFGKDFQATTFYQGKGCAYCNFTGYHGMTGVFDMLELNPEMREALRLKDTNRFVQLTKGGVKQSTLMINAVEMAKLKITTLSEVLRITGD